MKVKLRWLRLFANFGFFCILFITVINYKTSIYLLYQASGQLALLLNTQSLPNFEQSTELSAKEKENLKLIEQVKKCSVDSLGYEFTKNYERIYDQKDKPILWVVTASEPYVVKPYEWSFPIIGSVSYKGFFKEEFAIREFNSLAALGYDVDLRSVSAWSTLGWFNDPVLSSMLKLNKGSLCNLLFHELFHATYYAPGSVSFNENIASFVAHKATLRFLIKDTSALKEYLQTYQDNQIFNRYMLRKIDYLNDYYIKIKNNPNKHILKLKAVSQIADSILLLPLKNTSKYASRKEDILRFKNAYFVGFMQYDSMQDSLEEVFNKIYRGNIEKMAQDLKLN